MDFSWGLFWYIYLLRCYEVYQLKLNARLPFLQDCEMRLAVMITENINMYKMTMVKTHHAHHS